MMYGCDMQNLKQHIKTSAHKVHKSLAQGANLRSFILDACHSVVKDGSYLHPCIQNEKVYIAYSQTKAHRNMALASVTRLGIEKHKAHKFEDSADVIIALLASSSMGISGMPFVLTNDEGEEVKAADGAFVQVVPSLDEFSVRIKPFCDGGILGGKPEITPTEFVPGNYGLYPAALESLDHLYELGYQDMEAWLDQHLAQWLEKIRKGYADKGQELPDSVPPTEAFECSDNGMLWYEKVKRHVPTDWNDMTLTQTRFESKAACRVIKEGQVEVEVVAFAQKGDEAGPQSESPGGIHMHSSDTCKDGHCSVTGFEIRWHQQPELAEGEELAGRIPLVWVESVDFDTEDE